MSTIAPPDVLDDPRSRDELILAEWRARTALLLANHELRRLTRENMDLSRIVGELFDVAGSSA